MEWSGIAQDIRATMPSTHFSVYLTWSLLNILCCNCVLHWLSWHDLLLILLLPFWPLILSLLLGDFINPYGSHYLCPNPLIFKTHIPDCFLGVMIHRNFGHGKSRIRLIIILTLYLFSLVQGRDLSNILGSTHSSVSQCVLNFSLTPMLPSIFTFLMATKFAMYLHIIIQAFTVFIYMNNVSMDTSVLTPLHTDMIIYKHDYQPVW